MTNYVMGILLILGNTLDFRFAFELRRKIRIHGKVEYLIKIFRVLKMH